MTEATDTQPDRDEVIEAVGEEHVADTPDPVEIAARSADMTKPSTEHRKVFVLGPDPSSPSSNPYTESRGYDHEANKAATRQYAIDQGMWPTDEVRFVSGKRHDDGISWVLTYAVNVIPAHDAPLGGHNPEVVADDTDEGGATKAQNAEPANEPTA